MERPEPAYLFHARHLGDAAVAWVVKLIAACIAVVTLLEWLQ